MMSREDSMHPPSAQLPGSQGVPLDLELAAIEAMASYYDTKPGCAVTAGLVRDHQLEGVIPTREVIEMLKAVLAGGDADRVRLDLIRPGFRYLASTQVEQVLWPDADGKVSCQVNVHRGAGVRAAIDAARALYQGERNES